VTHFASPGTRGAIGRPCRNQIDVKADRSINRSYNVYSAISQFFRSAFPSARYLRINDFQKIEPLVEHNDNICWIILALVYCWCNWKSTWNLP